MNRRTIVRKKNHSVACCHLALVIILMAALLVLSHAYGQDVAPKTAEPQKRTAVPTIAAIPVPEIATRATKASTLLRALNTRLAPSPQIDTIQKQLPEVSARIDRTLTEAVDMLKGQPTLEAPQAEEQLWQAIEAQMSGWLEVLTERSVALTDALDKLAGMKATWTKTRDAARASKAPGPVLQQVDGVLAAVNAAQRPLEAQRSAV